jgi:hypothetical protein
LQGPWSTVAAFSVAMHPDRLHAKTDSEAKSAGKRGLRG